MKNRCLVGILGLCMIAGLVYGALVFGGLAPIAATDKHSSFVEWTMQTALRNAVRRGATKVTAPKLDGEETLRPGATLYDEMCVSCHAAPGKEADDELVDGLYPKPPELSKLAENRTPEELYWVTKYGIKMTGMPAWGPTHKESELWAMVAFMRALPKMSPSQYKQILLEAPDAAQAGHESPESASEHTHHEAHQHGAEHEHGH